VSYKYDGAGRLLNRILSNGAQTDYRYGADNRLIGLKNRSADKTVVEDLTYQRDNLGNITRISNTVGGKAVIYTYDALSRLSGADSTVNSEDRAYTYDKVGNRRTETKNGTTYVYCYQASACSGPPQGNRLFSIRTGAFIGPLYRQFVYDDAGRVTAKQDGGGTVLYTLNYNSKGRVVAAIKTGFTLMGYDANDYRVRKSNQLYHLEGENLEATYDSAGTLQNKYLRGVVVDEIVNGYTYHSSNPNDWTNYTFHHDHLNSVTALTGHTGTVDETTTYDAFGNPTLTLPGTGNDLLYTGREYDQETGLYYYRARYYDPEIGQFTSEDPLRFKAGINFYSYCNNNPINCNDPSGLESATFTAFVRGFGGSLEVGRDDPSGLPFVRLKLGIGVGGGFTINPNGNLPRADSLNNTGRANNIGVSADVGATAGNFNFSATAEALRTRTQNTFGSISSGVTNPTPKIQKPSIAVDNPFGLKLSGSLNFLDISATIPGIDPAAQFNDGVSVPGNFATIQTPGASGGFVLYPNKPNNNALQQVYRK